MSEKPHIWEIDCATMTWIKQPLSRKQALRASAGALLGLSAMGALAACGGGSSGTTGGAATTTGASTAGGGGLPGEGKTIALSLNGFNTFDQNTAEGVLKALNGTGYKLIGAEAAFDATKEVNNIKQLIAQRPDGLIVLAASAEGAARACQDAVDAGIPVVTQIWFPVDPEVDSVYFAATQLQEKKGGEMTIDFIAQEQGITEGKILEIVGLDAQPFSEGFKQGIRAGLEKYPGLEIVASQQGFYTAEGALDVLKPMLTANPDAKVIIDYAAEMGNAIARELEQQGRTDICHVTSDGNDAMIEWLKKDDGAYLKAARWFSPGSEGICSVNILRNKMEKGEDPTTENIGVEGYEVVEGTSNPIVIHARELMATSENIDDLPPFGYPEYTDQIPFGG
jgi:ABC-type sugar transport system substrate-binding protein